MGRDRYVVLPDEIVDLIWEHMQFINGKSKTTRMKGIPSDPNIFYYLKNDIKLILTFSDKILFEYIDGDEVFFSVELLRTDSFKSVESKINLALFDLAKGSLDDMFQTRDLGANWLNYATEFTKENTEDEEIVKTCRNCVYYQDTDLVNGESISYCTLFGKDVISTSTEAENCENFEQAKED